VNLLEVSDADIMFVEEAEVSTDIAKYISIHGYPTEKKALICAINE